ncbi:hypothetical protein VEx25_0490, partial [Vibrio antiquarius]
MCQQQLVEFSKINPRVFLAGRVAVLFLHHVKHGVA